MSCNTPDIETERLLLRKFNEQDLPAVLSIFGDEEVNRFLPWFPLKSIDDAKEFYKKKYEEQYNQSKGYQYAICLKSDNIPIGYAKINIDESYDLGYGLKRNFGIKALFFEACKAIVQQAKFDGIPYITATHDINNPRSGNVMKRLGMQYQYSYLEQWQPKDIPVIFRMYQLNFDKSGSFVYRKYWNNSEKHFVETENL